MYLVTLKNNEKLFFTDSKRSLERYILTNIDNIYYVKKEEKFLTLSELENELGMDLFLTRFDKALKLAKELEDGLRV